MPRTTLASTTPGGCRAFEVHGRTSTTEAHGTLEIRLLGHVRAVRDGAPIDLGGVRAETLLALLALRAGSPVSTDALIEELWAGEPPDGASTTLRSYVSRLRAALGAVPIRRVPAGYVLELPSDRVDIARFEALVDEGRALLERHRHRRAADVLRAALALWRDQPFAGVAEDGVLRAEAVRLEELRMHALESRLEADLEAGRAGELVNELESLVGDHPFRERLWRQLMLALYRSGRQADALAAYHRARAALDEQLGIEPSEELRELEAAILRHEVPQPQGVRRGGIALPVPLTSFVGRERELAAVRALLGRARLVTLVGVGGVGKTRLATEVARQALEDIAEGVAFVDLAALTDPALLESHVAASLGVSDGPERDLPAALAERVGTTDFLLVLDNCEHVRSAAADLSHRLLAASADLRILATSREVLDVAGEAPYPVPPLEVPGQAAEPDAVRNSEAVRLLVERTALTRHDFQADDAAYETAARICRELDGLPLAIEIAAARTKALSLDEIAVRLRDRFQFLVSWRRLSAARHRTLREAMDWSYDLLADDEQRLLARLSIFPAGATLESIAAVCMDGAEGEAERLLERLVDVSLLVPIDGVAGTRYRFLETVRQYAAERLQEPERFELQRRHALRVRSLAEATNLGLESASHASRFDLAREELPSIRAAIHWAGEHEPGLAVEIASSLERFWGLTRPREGLAIFDGLLAHRGITDAQRASALRGRGGCRYATGDFAAGVDDYQRAIEIHRRLGHRAHEAHLLTRLVVEAVRVRDTGRARELLEEAATVGGESRFTPDEYVSLDLEAHLAFEDGRDDEGFALLTRASDRADAAGDTMWQISSLGQRAERALDRGRLDEAGRAARAALRLAHDIEDRQSVVWALAYLARLAAASGSPERAGRLWGGLEAEVERGGPVGQWEAEQDAQRATVEVLAGDPFPAAVEGGRTLTLAEVVAEALADR